ncbi:MAG: NAD(P)-dependent alcohol dehydrogenase [Actinomycetota bacterium]|nr:NAD(P)-dependent alcohol dehydrogenase [Actinomycetota bacterium]
MITNTHQPNDTHSEPTATDMMRAIVQDRYGSSDTWQLTDVERPEIEAHEVLVHVHAAGLDRGTWHSMTGRPYLMRVIGFGLRAPKNRVPGLALAGTVVAVGADVTRFAVGDEVFGVGRGAFAEYAAAREDKLAHMPSTLTFEQAAAVPVSATTALQGLRLGRIEAGQQVLIIGASGGVGTYAVQIAKALGCEVTGVCSAVKADLVRSLGADDVIDYATDDATDGSRRYDLILDIAGNTSLRRLRRALAPTGSLVIVGGEGKGNVTGGLGRSLRAPLVSIFVRPRLTMLASKEHHADLLPLTRLIDAGQVVATIDRTYPLSRARDAMRQLEAGTVRGKICITMPG